MQPAWMDFAHYILFSGPGETEETILQALP
jgi:hypothetical protein